VLNEPTLEKLRALRLDGMVAAWQEQQKSAEIRGLDFDERLGLLVDAEWLRRENKRLKRNLREAKLRLAAACIEDIDCGGGRGLDRATLRQLATCAWVADHRAVVVTGATGTGKTFVACALAQQACRRGHRALYRRASRLYDELRLARADGTHAGLLSRLAKLDVLVLDDWGLAPLRDDERRDLLEVLDDRHGLRATVITSQMPTTEWHLCIGDPTIADAICDRVLHGSINLALKGPSRRKEGKPAADEGAADGA
jgi:DNA replication protein DnaC